MTINDTIKAVATALLDTIRDTSEGAMTEPSEEVYTDLACRLVLRLARQGVTILPAAKVIQPEQQAAAQRTLDALTGWLRDNPTCIYVTELGASGRVEVTFLDRDDEVRAFLSGGTVQDAYAQAAQVIVVGGAL